MQLRKDIDRVMARIHAFSSDNTSEGALIHVQSIGGLDTPPVAPLEQWDVYGDFRGLLDAQLAQFTAYWRQRAQLEDDLIPAISPYYGIAEHTAFLGGAVSFGANTSYHHAFLHDYADLDGLTLDENNRWFRLVMDGLAYLKEQTRGLCEVKLRGAEAPMDMANAVRGNEMFVDFFEEEDNLRRLLRFCQEGMRLTMARQREIVGAFEGGTICGFGAWLPGTSFGHLSEDASTMCSPQQYRSFGLPYTRDALEGYDTALMHTHTLGRHALSDIASIDVLKYIEISRDPNEPAPVEVFRENEEALRGKVVLLPATIPEMEANLDLLRRHKVIIPYQAADMEDAVRAVRFVRERLS